jgi:xylulokinase
VNPGAAVIELGGQGCLFVPTPEALRDPQGRLASTCHSVPGTWAFAANDLAGSTGLDWIMEQVLPAEVAQARRNQRDPIDLLAELAAEVAPGADGLMHVSSSIRPGAGGFIGLEARHGRGHLVRAVLEGGALACRRALAALAELKRVPDQVLATGPGAANHLWCQILADALDRPITAVASPESAAFGAGVLAAAAVGMFKTVDDACAKLVKAKATFQPRRAASDAYAALAPIAARIPETLAAAFAPKTVEAQA